MASDNLIEKSNSSTVSRPMKTHAYAYSDLPCCPVCRSDEVTEFSEDEKNHALALYDLYDHIGRIQLMTMEFQCHNCGYQW